MKTKNIIILLILIILNLGIIYLAFSFGKNQAVLTNSQIGCLAEGVSEDNIIISQEQAICLAKNEEIEKICGTGCPLARPADSTTLSLKSNKKVILGNSVEFENYAKNLGVRFFVK